MTPSEIESIVAGCLSDAFGVLGPHEKEDGTCQVRAFFPGADAAWVKAEGRLAPMSRLHKYGVFEAALKSRPAAYTLVRTEGGEEIECEDPYRFATLLSEFDIHLHGEGTNYEAYRSFGAHLASVEEIAGVRFAVWAPNAEVVSVVGDFNGWDTRRHPMRQRDGGIWELFLPGIGPGTIYKYSVRSRIAGHHQLKCDPSGFASEVPPRTGSVVWDTSAYSWQDRDWMSERSSKNYLREPVSVYEVHLGSWLHRPGRQSLSYRELAETLVEYAVRLGYTHLELMPVMEHPFSGSWGYQVAGYYAPTARFGTPDDFKYFVDRCHRRGLGVIADWVPAHFPKDAHGLARFDGTALYEHADPRLGEHRDWGTLIFNYGRHEVREFLISNALFWLKEYHIDGLRVDAVASMIYLDYSRQPGEWIPNIHGGRESLEALDMLRKFNELAHRMPGAITLAEESTAFPGVSRPLYLNGLGFTMKWNMGWMHDMLDYFSHDAVHRKYHHNNITFSMLYAFTENFLLPISHDEVVHGKGSLIAKMPGDYWQKFANVRAFLAYMFGHPGKKLMFMGCEIGQWDEWDHNDSVRWELLEYDQHRQLQTFVGDLNRLYRSHPAMYEVDYDYKGFAWVDFHDYENSIIAFERRAAGGAPELIFCCNFTPVPRHLYRIGVRHPGVYREIFNSDAGAYGGSNMGNGGAVTAGGVSHQGHYHSIEVTLPPLAVVVFEAPVVTPAPRAGAH